MGHIKEPKSVAFVIASDPLTEYARKEIHEFILNYKNNLATKKAKSTKSIKPSKALHS